MDFFSLPVAYASLDSVITSIGDNIINPLIAFLFALAILYFLYGVLEFFLNQENEEKKTTGKQHMLWGIIGITIMMGVWTILTLIVNTLGVSDEVNIKTDGSGGGSADINLK